MPTGKKYNEGLLGLNDGTIDFLTDDIRALWVDEDYVFGKTHKFVSDVSANEITNDGTTTGYERKALASKTVALDGDSVNADAADLTYTAIKAADDKKMAKAIIYKYDADDAAARLVCANDALDGDGNASPLPTNGSDVTATISTDGIYKLENILV